MDEKVTATDFPSVGHRMTPTQAMRLAIAHGSKGVGFVSPNPLVGCVIVDHEHRFLSAGYHRKIGGDHAEVDAFKQLSTITGCHLYVTLEPCAHQGRTPSCAKTLATMKPASVTYAVEDPNPLVSGKGAAILSAVGIKAQLFSDRTDVPPIEKIEVTEEAEELAEIFLHVHRTKSPFVAVKVATSLDGQMAMQSGESKWITSDTAREHVHLVRAQYDAVAVGHATFFSDDPSLNVRHPNFPGYVNRAVLFDFGGSAFSALAKSKLLSVRPAENVVVVTGPQVAKGSTGVRHIQVPIDDEGNFEMKSLLEGLKAEGLNSILVEGGAYTFGSFFQANAVQRVHVYVAPVLVGGRHAINWSRHFGGAKLSEKLDLARVKRRELGPDLYWTGSIGRQT